MTVLLLAASPSPKSRSAALLEIARGALESRGVESLTLSLRDLPAEPLLLGHHAHAALADALGRVADARAVVIATPIYKAAYSGLLKVFLDLLPQAGLRGKRVWPLATGGSPAHTLALDHSLRPVLDNLGAEQVLQSVYALESQLAWQDALASVRVDAEIRTRIDQGAARLTAALRPESARQPLAV